MNQGSLQQCNLFDAVMDLIPVVLCQSFDLCGIIPCTGILLEDQVHLDPLT